MESETEGQAHEVVASVTAAAQMRGAREAAGLELAEVASRTRVPLRHLEALERGDFAALPGITYCAGFARAYARAVGLDEKALVAKVREEIDATGDFAAPDAYQIEEPADPARVPPRALAWVVAIAGLALVSGYGLWRMQINTPPREEVVAAASTPSVIGAVRPRPVASSVPTGPVVLTAVEDVWLRIYDADGKSLMQKTLAKGESFTVPADANNPMILTGRPDALAVTIGGRAIPPLGTAERTISDVPISAAALLARGSAQATVTGVAQPAPPATVQQGAGPQIPAARAPAAGQTAGRPVQATTAQPSSARSQPASRSPSTTESRRTQAPARTETRPVPSAPTPAAAPAPTPAANSAGQ